MSIIQIKITSMGQSLMFFSEQLNKMDNSGKLFLPAEGEGRNTVYAAQQGWGLDAFDICKKSQNKSFEMEKHHHTINYTIRKFQDFKIKTETYNVIAFDYAHLHNSERRDIHQRFIHALKPGGYLILEAFSKEQLGRDSGGPQDLNMLYDLDELCKDFTELEMIYADAPEPELQEGNHHVRANVIRLLLQKPQEN